MASKLEASVGKGGVNRQPDVIAVQAYLLNWINLGPLRGKVSAPTVSGKCDPATIAAIGAFQKLVVGMAYPDHRVDPNGNTYRRLSGPLTLSIAQPAGGRTQELTVSFKLGAHSYERLPFLSAVRAVTNYTNAEHEACDELVKYTREDQWFAGFWSELLGGASPPAYAEWLQPISKLRSATSAYNAGVNDKAIEHLKEGVALYNRVHKRWYAYRRALEKGANRSITTIEITMLVIEAGVSGGVAVANRSLLYGAAASGLLTMYERTALGVGKKARGVQDKWFDVADVALNSAGSFVGSLIAGRLVNLFLGKLAQRLVLGPLARHIPYTEVQKQAALKGLLLPKVTDLQKFVFGGSFGLGSEVLKTATLNAASRLKGKGASMPDFVGGVVDAIPESTVVPIRSELKSRYSQNQQSIHR